MLPRTLILLALPFGTALAATADEGADFFEKKIRPLLVERCLECHSDEHKVKGGLRLDSKEGWQAGGDAGPALVPGNLEESLLIKAVRYRDSDLKMPPKKKLPAAEVALLEEWVRMGAPDPRTGAASVKKKQVGMSIEDGRKFWSYVAPKKAAPPVVKDAAWPRNDIDRFILAKIEEKGARLAPDAAPEVLARRIYYTLTGLPPSPEEVDAFVRSATRDPESAIASTVDRLLQSPHFGERWGRHWLDVARFAESSGGGRTLLFKDAWRYRDYVIEAFNRDQPFDEFLREQIAGDLLPAADTADQRRKITATAFLALGPTNYEEQDKQQLRFDIIDEQLDTIGKAVLGQTVGCARCHDHKFDPIPQRDYYALAGVFASTRTLFNYTDNVARWIARPLTLDGDEEHRVAAHEAKLAAIKDELDAAKKELARAKARAVRGDDEPGKALPVAGLAGIVIDDEEAKAIGHWKVSQNKQDYVGEGYRTDGNEAKGTKTLTFAPKIPKTGRYEVRFAYTAGPNRADKVPVLVFHADGQETIYVNQKDEPALDGHFVSLGKFRFEQDGAGFVLVSNEDTKGHVIADAVQFLSEEVLTAEASAPPPPGAEGEKRRALDERVKEIEGGMKKLAKDGPQRPSAMAVREDDEIADTHIRVRGLVAQKGALVPRGFMQVLGIPSPQFPQKESGRREVADWLTSPANPLTARVFVNRVWGWVFGQGIVRTTENFGTTGELPSHPELLDWLAVRFVEEGWSVKRLVREMLLSRTWRLAVQAEIRNPKSEIRNFSDPDNRLFSHASRRRLDAEQIRDTMLAVSGQLDLRVLGPNIGGAGEINANDSASQNVEYKYEFTDVRRSVYTPAFRNRRLELFEAFDFGDINAPIGHRHVSTVAPQALYLLNHPFVLEQAKLAAERALASSATDEERLTNAFRTALCRVPSEKERAIFNKLLRDAGEDRRAGAWSQIYQTLFACLDFRYLD